MTKQRETAPPPQEVEEKEAAPPSADFALTPEQATFLLQSGMLLLAVFVVLYVAKAIILPVILAFVLKLLMNPAFRWLQRLGLPRVLGALLLLVALSATIVGLAAALSGPAVDWFAKLPGGIPRLQERLEFLRQPVEIFRRFLTAMRGLAPLDSAVVAIPTSEGTLPDQLFAGTWNFAAGLFTTGLLLFFLMISGDTFLRKLVEILPSFSEKRQAVEMSQQIESDISAYLATVTIMNAAVGIATGLVMWACGVGDPVLWAAVAFLLNYVPILGPLLGIGVFVLAGRLIMDTLWEALLPAGLYLGVHVVEGEGVTPMPPAKRFILNPVLVILALVFWYRMLGVPGAILAVPFWRSPKSSATASSRRKPSAASSAT